MPRKLTTEKFIKRAKEVHGEVWLILLTNN